MREKGGNGRIRLILKLEATAVLSYTVHTLYSGTLVLHASFARK